MSVSPGERIAVIGSGISGLGAAWLLSASHHVTVYDKESQIGGHSRTIRVNTDDGEVPVDTGFIVFNERNYPNLTRFFELLGVPTAASDMSFGVSIADHWLEYSTSNIGNIFAQRANLLRLSFWRMLADILRFNRNAQRYLNSNTEISLAECLDELGMSEWFRQYYLLAMGGAIWSTPLERMYEFPARAFIRFFSNHGLLSVNDQPQWHTVRGGSTQYLSRLVDDMDAQLRLGAGVVSVQRDGQCVKVLDELGREATYDQVVFACHADQALAMLQQPTGPERQILGSFRFQPNDMVLHSDTSFMPHNRQAWASWVYLSEGKRDQQQHVSLSYWMNNLQPLATSQPMIVTLNPGHEPDPSLVHDRHRFTHPLFDTAAVAAQERIGELQGQQRSWFCGAWQRYGFHEDGLLSAMNVARGMGVAVPWGP